MGFAVRVRSAGQKYGPTCHQRDRADVTESVTLVRLSSLGQHVGVLALAGYKRRKSALTAGPIGLLALLKTAAHSYHGKDHCHRQQSPAALPGSQLHRWQVLGWCRSVCAPRFLPRMSQNRFHLPSRSNHHSLQWNDRLALSWPAESGLIQSCFQIHLSSIDVGWSS